MRTSRPYEGGTCDRREHRLPYMRLIKPGDDRMHACSCGSTLIGNGVVILREKVLDARFPQRKAAV
jgi:hypothetical protein